MSEVVHPAEGSPDFRYQLIEVIPDRGGGNVVALRRGECQRGLAVLLILPALPAVPGLQTLCGLVLPLAGKEFHDKGRGLQHPDSVIFQRGKDSFAVCQPPFLKLFADFHRPGLEVNAILGETQGLRFPQGGKPTSAQIHKLFYRSS